MVIMFHLCQVLWQCNVYSRELLGTIYFLWNINVCDEHMIIYSNVSCWLKTCSGLTEPMPLLATDQTQNSGHKLLSISSSVPLSCTNYRQEAIRHSQCDQYIVFVDRIQQWSPAAQGSGMLPALPQSETNYRCL